MNKFPQYSRNRSKFFNAPPDKDLIFTNLTKKKLKKAQNLKKNIPKQISIEHNSLK